MTPVVEKSEAAEDVVRVRNVFEALGLAPEIAVLEREKVQLAARINEALSKRGRSQVDRAAVLGVAQPVISNLERFELATISLDRLVRYAAHLELNPSISTTKPKR